MVKFTVYDEDTITDDLVGEGTLDITKLKAPLSNQSNKRIISSNLE